MQKYDYMPSFLCFNDTTPYTESEVCVGNMVVNYNYKEADVEAKIEKCRLICRHCHAIYKREQMELGVWQEREQKMIKKRRGRINKTKK